MLQLRVARIRGGYDYSFVNAPRDDLICKICHHPSREPHLSGCCGHTFCKTCLDDVKRANSVDEEVKNSCPMCRAKNFVIFPNKQNERAVKNLHIFCTNKDKGCDWQGELNSIVAHLTNSDGCPFEEASCSNECGLSLQRQHLRKHVDTECPRSRVTCQYCNIIGERQFIDGQHHKDECRKFPLPCPNKCEIKTVPREIMDVHRTECPLEMIQCDYYEMGCKDNMARKDEVKHYKEEMANHLSLVKSEYLQTKSKLADTEKTVTTTKNKLAETENQLSLLKSEYLQTKSKLADTEKTVTTTKNMLIDTEKTVTTTKNKLEDAKQTVTTTKLELINAEKKIRELESSMGHRIQLVENIMFKHLFKWYTTLEERVKSQHTKVPVTLKMSEYSKKKGSDSDWYSNSFSWELSVFDQYPQIKLRVIPAGYADGKGTHLSVQLYLVKGGCERDFVALEQQIEVKLENVKQQWAFFDESRRQLQNQKKQLEKEREELRKTQMLCSHLRVMILNQITDSEHYSVRTSQMDLRANYFRTNEHCNVQIFARSCFIPNEVLYKSTTTCRYLKDDNVYFLIKTASD